MPLRHALALIAFQIDAPPGEELVHRTWPPLPEAIASFGAAELDGAIYAYGGHVGRAHAHSRDNLRGTLLRLDEGGASWEPLASGPPLQGTALVACDSALIRVGGLSARNPAGEPEDLHSDASVQRFDPATGRWNDLPSLPEPRSSHDAIAVEGSLYVIGGWTISGSEKRFAERNFVLDLRAAAPSWKSLPPLPDPRRALAVAKFGESIAAIGGLTDLGDPCSTVEFFDPKASTWSTGPELPSDGFGASAVFVDGALLVSGRDGVVWRLRPGESAWREAGGWIEPRFFHRLVAVSGELVNVGGSAKGGHVRLVESLPLAALTGGNAPRAQLQSISVKLPGRARNRQAMVLSERELLLFGGNRSRNQHDFAPEDFCNDVVRVDLRNATAELLEPLPVARQSMVAARADSLGLLIGGFSNAGERPAACYEVLAYDFESRTARATGLALPEPRTQFHVAFEGDRLWIAGGLDYDKNRDPAFEFPLDLLKLDPRALDRPVEKCGIVLQRPRRAFGAAMLDGRWHFVGGMAGEFEPVRECEVFDFRSGIWSKMPAPSATRISPELVALRGKLHLLGGLAFLEGRDTAPATSVEQFDPADGAWTTVIDELPFETRHMRAFSHRGRLLMVTPEATDYPSIRLTWIDLREPVRSGAN